MADLRVLQRVIFPREGNLDIVPLYVETDVDRGAALVAVHEEAGGEAFQNAAVGQTQSSVRFASVGSGDTPQRRTAHIRAGKRISFATYFNAFPAGYWRRWSVVDAVTLRLAVRGEATVVVYRSTARGHSYPVHTVDVDTGSSDRPQNVEVSLPLTPFIDGGWYWFDVTAGAHEATLIDAEWAAVADQERVGRMSIGITTYNRPDFVVDLLRSIGEYPDALELIDAVYLIDQGTTHASDHPDFADATKPLGDRLHVIEQANLGGSGGFSRAMHETLNAEASQYVLLLDDDVVLEPESLIRAATFADLARRPTIVGGHMFSLHDRSVLHAFAETVTPYRWWWGAAPHTHTDHDFGRRSLRHTPWLHRRVDADYNGWWMCLIPTSVIAELGLALPVFIKWDDAEYGLRARRAGYPVVSLPGVAVWHVPWGDKNDAYDWQAYFHVRNRMVAALLHSPYDRGGRVVAESFETQYQHLVSMQYSSAALRLLALEDLLSGPEHMHAELGTKLAALRALRAEYQDAATSGSVDDFPAVRRRKPPGKGKEPKPPKNPAGLVVRATLGGIRQFTPPSMVGRTQPAVALPYQDASWWRLTGLDSALVSTPDGASTAWYRRDPKLFRELSRRSVLLHARLLAAWPRLRHEYRAAASEFTSRERWEQTFAGGSMAGQ